ncbi:FecR family protein [Aquimarina agarilytica]|uniref:FecR family protein n=1 Tax=Aquimarina agarilytica TaxID=1087449 RepID=UPI0012F9F320|nr:FecR family protein [Aquimarina agarilytica]
MMNFNDDTFLARWLNNELTDEELKNFKASDDYAKYAKIAEKTKQFQIPAFDKEGIKATIQSTIQKKPSKLIPLYTRWASVAAVILIAVFAGTFYWMSLPSVFTSKNGERLVFELPDGSSVELNGTASVSFSKKDWKQNKRNLSLTGEGYFKVKKGSKFNVQTPNGTVSVVGTQFNVHSLNDYFAVECYEGKVKVAHKTTTTMLTPGHGIRFKNKHSENIAISNTIPNWMNNNYNYSAVPLHVVLNDIQNVYKMTIDLQKVDTSQEFTGKLITYDINKALKAVCTPMGLTYSIKKANIVINSN